MMLDADRAPSGVERLRVAGVLHGVGMRSPSPKDALRLPPAGRVAGIVHRLPGSSARCAAPACTSASFRPDAADLVRPARGAGRAREAARL